MPRRRARRSMEKDGCTPAIWRDAIATDSSTSPAAPKTCSSAVASMFILPRSRRSSSRIRRSPTRRSSRSATRRGAKSESRSSSRVLLDRYFEAMSKPDFPFNKALVSGTFPENLETLGHAARDMVRDYREYVSLIYVDVVEFDAAHVRKFYEDMAARFSTFLKAH